ncbi:MAG: DUF3341 domain-containing protein [Phycisphaerae bacterium]|jgi:hypothetical protein|nr:DUF3341 domain-containing protein [Phycisphaerae bacterium]
MSTVAHTTTSATPTGSKSKVLYGYIAEFETPGAVMAAAERVKAEGYERWDVCTPFPVHGMDKAMGVKRTILPVVIFGGGMTGTIAATLLQIFTNSTGLHIPIPIPITGYPFLISGKPLMSIPAFIPVMFELTVLFAALTAVFGMFIMNGLPRLSHPLFGSDRFRRVTNDRFFVVIEARDARFLPGKTEAFLKSLNPLSVEAVEE